MTNRCLEHVPATSLVDEDDMALRRSEFNLVNLTGKRALHEHHSSRKKCRLWICQYIIDAFGPFTSKKTWNRFNEVVGNPDVTVEDVEALALEAILSVINKNEIVKLWCEKLLNGDSGTAWKGPVLRSLGSKPIQRSRLSKNVKLLFT